MSEVLEKAPAVADESSLFQICASLIIRRLCFSRMLSMSLTLNRWKVVVDFVGDHDVSDISLWGENLTARMDGQTISLAEAGALSKEAVSEMISELLMINP